MQTIFLEEWTLGDCRYHLKTVVDPKLERSRGIISFGKNLRWDMKDVALFNGPKVTLQIRGQSFSNISDTSKERLRWVHSSSFRQSYMLTLPRPFAVSTQPADPIVRYLGGVLCLEDQATIASRLISCLFYIELTSKPNFYCAPEIAQLRLLCRLSPGPPLISLIKGLHMRKAGLFYRSDDTNFSEETLVSGGCLRNCVKGMPFSRLLNVSVHTLSCRIDVRIESRVGAMECISNCPYELKTLIKDQGLDCSFGRNDHRAQDDFEICSEEGVEEEIGRLHDTLDSVIDSYSKL